MLFNRVIRYVANCFGVELENGFSDNESIVGFVNADSGVTGFHGGAYSPCASVVIPIKELKEEIEKADIISEKTKGLEVFSEKLHYECAVQLEESKLRRRGVSEEVSLAADFSNATYSFGPCSLHYCLFCIIKYFESSAGVRRGGIASRFSFKLRRAGRLHRFGRQSENSNLEALSAIDWKMALPRLIGIFSISIDAKSRMNITQMREHADSFEFKFMYCNNIALRRVIEVDEFLYDRSFRADIPEGRELSFPPLKRYDKDAINHYRLAITSSDPYVEFLSFYHVLEHYFGQAYKKGLASRLRKALTSVSFSLDEDVLFKIAKEIEKEMHGRKEEGYGIEKNELKYLLNEYVAPDSLSQELAAGHIDWKKYYAENKVSFEPNAPKIDWESQNVVSDISNRIYKVRNASIHSKQREDGGYKPFVHEEKLAHEIPLIRCIAEKVIDEAGAEFDS